MAHFSNHSEENYLKTLFKLGNQPVKKVNNIALAKELELNPATVLEMIRKLTVKKMVKVLPDKSIQLTDNGKKKALLTIRQHRLTEMFLVQQMGFGWEEVHEIAEQIEHLQSPAFFEKMDSLLGYPKIDPHGSPIPDKNGKMEWLEYEKLSNCKEGDTLKLSGVLQTSDEFLKFLNTRELKLGQKIKIKAIEKFDGSMTISYGKKAAEMLSHTVCERLLVEKL